MDARPLEAFKAEPNGLMADADKPEDAAYGW